MRRKSRIRRLIERIIDWCRACVAYAGFLWRNGGDWDHGILLALIQFKLERMRKHVLAHNIHTSAKIFARQIRVAEILIERLNNDQYGQKDWDDLKEKWGELELIPHISGHFEAVRSKVTPENRPQYNWEREHAYKKSVAGRKRDLDYLFRHMRKHVEKWWC